MIFLAAFVLLLSIFAPLFVIYRRVKSGKRGKAPLLVNICSFFGIIVVATICLFSQSAVAADAAGLASAAGDTASLAASLQTGLSYIAAALAVGISGIGGGIAVASSAAAALGALSENESLFGKSLIFVGMAEGVALYGLLIAFMILMG